jgi:hypothetical protein
VATKGKKREIKAKIKEESKTQPQNDDSVPLTLNYNKFLLEEKKNSILLFARTYLSEENLEIFSEILATKDLQVSHDFQDSQQFAFEKVP